MGSKIALRIAALAIGTAFVAVPALAQQQPLSPQPKNGSTEYLRSAAPPAPNAATAPGPYYNYAPGPAPAAGSTDWCAAHFRSYDPATGMYRGFDGLMHPCP